MVLVFAATSASYAASVEQYMQSVEKISTQYKEDMRSFLRSLDPQTTSFNLEQQMKFCAIMNQYVQDSYEAIERNRSALTGRYASLTKRDMIQQVNDSKEIQLLKKYNIQCDLH